MKIPVLNDQMRAYLASQPPEEPSEDGADPFGEGLEAMREMVRAQAAADGGEPEPVAEVEELDIDGVRARLYFPAGGERQVLVWLHGGAWIVDDIDSYDTVTRRIANRSGCAVLSVDYRLAPEHPFPAGLEDAWAATLWATERFDRVAVGGDSAGGNLAAVIALRARDRGVELAFQLLVYPSVDTDIDTPFYREYRETYTDFAGSSSYGADEIEQARRVWEIYVPDAAQRELPDVAPLRAASLAGVAPALIVIAEHDSLRGEGEAYAARLEAEGVPVETHAYDGHVHGFFTLLGRLDDAGLAVDRASAALRRALGDAKP